ncbi:LysM peptidoglycan-binding domain-containing protein [Clostridium bornimense]|uniref:LysM peptidoglycan-binding domain-containing protein n=1 Tax=Clostridium bornimense TaxID=1216932 RepID=UPI001C11CC62|nr:LysM domain-containing protein [Clostridium bornimense]MBU5317868.1 LysM peptidoglycan-binding domain-containing protein [Clostridium bornimense]
MNKKKVLGLSAILILVLIGGLVIYNNATNLQKDIKKSTNNLNNNSTAIEDAKEKTINDLNSTINTGNNTVKDSSTNDKNTTDSDKTESKTTSTNIAKEGVHFNYINYTIKSGDTLFSIAKENAPNLAINDVINNIKIRNKLSDENLIKSGDTISIPSSIKIK